MLGQVFLPTCRSSPHSSRPGSPEASGRLPSSSVALLSLSFGTKRRDSRREEEQVGLHVAYFWIVDTSLPAGICGQPGHFRKGAVACWLVNIPTLGREGALLRRRGTKGPLAPLV